MTAKTTFLGIGVKGGKEGATQARIPLRSQPGTEVIGLPSADDEKMLTFIRKHGGPVVDMDLETFLGLPQFDPDSTEFKRK